MRMESGGNKKPGWEIRHTDQACHPGFTSEFTSSYLFSFLLLCESPLFGLCFLCIGFMQISGFVFGQAWL